MKKSEYFLDYTVFPTVKSLVVSLLSTEIFFILKNL